MFSLRQTVSLLLFGFGVLLVLLGLGSIPMSLFFLIEPPEGVAPEAARLVTTFFTIGGVLGGVLGLTLIAWSIYLRSHKSWGDSWPLWVTYVVLLGPLVGLAVYEGWDSLVETAWKGSSPRGSVGNLRGLFILLLFFLGPIILLVRRILPSTRRQDDHQHHNTQPGVAAPGNWRFRPVGSLVFVAIIAGIYGLASWLGDESFSVAGLVFGVLIFSVLVFRPLRNLVFYPPPRPPLDQVGLRERPQPKAEPDAAERPRRWCQGRKRSGLQQGCTLDGHRDRQTDPLVRQKNASRRLLRHIAGWQAIGRSN
jgi:hypothetical protein